MQSGTRFKEATVTEITEKYVAVEPVLVGDERRYLIQFDKNGKQAVWDGISAWEGLGVYEYVLGGWWQEDRRLLCGENCIPWKLCDTPTE